MILAHVYVGSIGIRLSKISEDHFGVKIFNADKNGNVISEIGWSGRDNYKDALNRFNEIVSQYQ